MAEPGTDVALCTRVHVTRRLIPYLLLIYILAYVDRANLGVAKLGMMADTGFNDAIIGFGAGIFFLGFLVMNIPAGFLVERWSARKLIAAIMMAWGVFASMMGFLGMRFLGALHVNTQFYLLRLLLGIAEAGFFPGVIVYLSHWYRPQDRARAKGYFMLAQPIAIAAGIPISGWILDRIHWFGMPSWRWVFWLEGVPPFIMAFVSLWYLTDRPQRADWLPDEERTWLVEKLRADEALKVKARRVSVQDALSNPQTFLLIAILFLIVAGNQALIFFLPSITNTMKALPAGLRQIAAGLPYACSALGILGNGIWAQRSGKLRRHTALPILATGVSLGLAVMARNHAGIMVALFCLTGFTAQAYMPAFWTLPTTLFGKSAAATAVGLIALGNLGGVAGPWLFGYLRDVTGNYAAGLWAASGCMILAGLLATQIHVAYAGENDVRNELEKEARTVAQL
jgi:MFS transporter, ACS family, tartrate transporter